MVDRDVSPPIVLERLGITYIPIPKAASSSVKLLCRRALALPDPDPWWKIHETAWPDLRPCGFLFTIVRSPWDRLWSCWRSKFVPERWAALRRHHDKLHVDMGFRDFLFALRDIDLDTANEHLRPQTALLARWEPVDFLKFEQLDYRWVESSLRLRLGPLPRLNAEPAPGKAPWTAEMVRLVARLYAEDCERLRYD